MPSAGSPPIVIVDGPADAFADAIVGIRSAGWRVVDGFTTAANAAPGVVCAGSIANEVHAGAALLAVLAGAGLVAHATAPEAVIDRLLDDLRHIGPIELRRRAEAATPRIAPDGRAILAILAVGRTLGDAAIELGLSRRTADRRLDEARRALGVERTVEAVAKARRLGLLG